jgi:stearoyl-CoA desaturase (delta-9 desaturase)
MTAPTPGPASIVADANVDACEGRVRWAPAKSLWIGAMTLTTLVFGPALLTSGAFFLFAVTTVVSLCGGHSVGMHRRLIHRSFDCPLWLERLLVYLGVLVGMSGPIGMARTHDLRDWAQRQPRCHAYFGHEGSLLGDGWRQLHCEVELARPPRFEPDPALARDRVHRWLERTWMAQQLPWAVLFYALGGWPWVVWGVCARVTVGVTGHWLVGHFAHRLAARHGAWRALPFRASTSRSPATSASARAGTTIITPSPAPPASACCPDSRTWAGG